MATAHMGLAQTRYVPLKATSMVYCPQDNRIYATGASNAKGNLANSVCRINPDTGKIEGSVLAGNRFAYGIDSRRRLHLLSTLSACMSWPTSTP